MMNKKFYEVPALEVLEIAVEQGFALSNENPGEGETWE